MFRNEQELLDSLLQNMKGARRTSKPLSISDLSEIEKYRDSDGVIDLTDVKDMNTLKNLIELVDKKNQTEEIGTDKSTREYIGDLINEILPLLGLDEAKLKVSTPAGTASVEVAQGKTPVVEYTTNDKEDKIYPQCTGLTYTTTSTSKGNEFNVEKDCIKSCNIALPEDLKGVLENLYNDKIETEEYDEEEVISDERIVELHSVGGVYNPEFYNAVHYICENEHFPECGVYRYDEVIPGNVDTYILLPNAFNKMDQDRVNWFASEMDNKDVIVYVINPETFELTEIMSSNELQEYAMTEAQEYSLR